MNRAPRERLPVTCPSAAWIPDWVPRMTANVLAAGKSLRYTRNQAAPFGVALCDRRPNGRGATARGLRGGSCEWGWVDV